MDTSFRWGNNQNLALPRHTYGTTSNKQTKLENDKRKKRKEKKRKERIKKKKKTRKTNGLSTINNSSFRFSFMKIHFEFVVD